MEKIFNWTLCLLHWSILLCSPMPFSQLQSIALHCIFATLQRAAATKCCIWHGKKEKRNKRNSKKYAWLHTHTHRPLKWARTCSLCHASGQERLQCSATAIFFLLFLNDRCIVDLLSAVSLWRNSKGKFEALTCLRLELLRAISVKKIWLA